MVMIHNMPKELREGFEDMLRKKDSKSMNAKKMTEVLGLGLQEIQLHQIMKSKLMFSVICYRKMGN